MENQQNGGGGNVAFSGQAPEDILRAAKMWEEAKDYHKAIDRYLEITEIHF